MSPHHQPGIKQCAVAHYKAPHSTVLGRMVTPYHQPGIKQCAVAHYKAPHSAWMSPYGPHQPGTPFHVKKGQVTLTPSPTVRCNMVHANPVRSPSQACMHAALAAS